MSERRPLWITASVLGLVVMATWTLVIKYLAPVLWFVSERAAGRAIEGPPIMWDFWWAAHLALAWWLWRRRRGARRLGLIVAVTEILIVVVKFAFYLGAPDWSFWRLLWFTNKLYVLAFFILFLVLIARPGARADLEATHAA